MAASAQKPARLTSEDVNLFIEVAAEMVAAHLWRSVDRRHDADSDTFEIYAEDYPGPALSVGVLATHRYFYMDHRSSAVGTAGSLEELFNRLGLLPAGHVRSDLAGQSARN